MSNVIVYHYVPNSIKKKFKPSTADLLYVGKGCYYNADVKVIGKRFEN